MVSMGLKKKIKRWLMRMRMTKEMTERMMRVMIMIMTTRRRSIYKMSMAGKTRAIIWVVVIAKIISPEISCKDLAMLRMVYLPIWFGILGCKEASLHSVLMNFGAKKKLQLKIL
jgi:hypothetical protein